MKKKITRPDGTIEEIEGTAEELAALERKSSKKSEGKKTSKRILNEGRITELEAKVAELEKQLAEAQGESWRKLLEEIQKTSPKQPWIEPYVPVTPFEPYVDPQPLIRPYKTVPDTGTWPFPYDRFTWCTDDNSSFAKRCGTC